MARDTNFYYSFLVLPSEKRRAIVAVWDFCRAVDDAVDEAEGPGAAAQEISRWRVELGEVFGGGAARTEQGRALAPFVRQFSLPRSAFEALIEGVEMDLGSRRYETFDDLYEYCIRVASAVGLICLEIFGYRNPSAKAYAENLGLALQLTNIIRDVRTDLVRGRVYLPTEDLVRFGVSEDDLRSGQLTSRVVELLRFECERAHSYYRRAAAQLPPEDAHSLVAAEIMGGIYFEILRRIERRGYDVFSSRIRVPRPTRAVVALRLWMKSLFR